MAHRSPDATLKFIPRSSQRWLAGSLRPRLSPESVFTAVVSVWLGEISLGYQRRCCIFRTNLPKSASSCRFRNVTMVCQGDKHRITGEVRFVVCQGILWTWHSGTSVFRQPGLPVTIPVAAIPWQRSHGSGLVGKIEGCCIGDKDKQRLFY